MKRIFFLFVILIIAINTPTVCAQSIKNPVVKKLIDTCITIMRNNAVNANAVNWAELKEHAYEKAANLKSPYEMGEVIRYLYQSINDFHGSFFYRDSTFQWHGKALVTSDSVMNQWKKRAGIKTALLDNNIGYLRIPSMPGGSIMDFNKSAQKLNDSLCVLLAQNLRGIILDLRINAGGVMYSMILGVEQLLGEGKVGSFYGKKEETWYIKGNRFYVDTALYATIAPKCNVNATTIPIVILTGTSTGSSGEFLTIAFKGRKHTVLLGTETAGYVTSITGIKINNEAFMNLAIGYGKDRHGKAYKEAIKPDIPFTAVDKFNDVKTDEKVKAAIDWIERHGK
jgi:carboxyl-terminal processing protease